MSLENRTAELGPLHFDWWKDWRGECVAIIASGPSTKSINLEVLRDRIHVVAIKKNIELYPWADVVYGCDAAWWKSVGGLPNYKGLKLSWVDGGCRYFPDVRKIEIEKNIDAILFDRPGVVGSGGNSAFQTVNIVAQFGVTGILAIGFDMHDRGGAHWYGRNGWPMANNPDGHNFKRWCDAFNVAAPDLKRCGIDVVNASPISALSCFRRCSVDEALAGWGL